MGKRICDAAHWAAAGLEGKMCNTHWLVLSPRVQAAALRIAFSISLTACEAFGICPSDIMRQSNTYGARGRSRSLEPASLSAASESGSEVGYRNHQPNAHFGENKVYLSYR